MQRDEPEGDEPTADTPDLDAPEPRASPPEDHRHREVRVSLRVSPNAFTLLLFVRSVWGLAPNGVPPVEFEPAPGNSQRPEHHDLDELNELWRSDWARALTQYEGKIVRVGGPDAAMRALLASSTDEELWHLMSSEPSPKWTSGVDRRALRKWLNFMHDPHRPEPEDTPEYRSLPALIGAWETGMRTIVQLPLAGYFADRYSKTHLLVSAPVRRDPELFNRAFAT